MPQTVPLFESAINVDVDYSAAAVRALRLDSGLTIPEAAAAAGVAKVTWVNYENGRIRMAPVRWEAFRQLVASGGHHAFMKDEGSRKGPRINAYFSAGAYEYEREDPLEGAGPVLALARNALGLPASEVATLIGIKTPAGVYKREAGQSQVYPSELRALLPELRMRAKELAKARVHIRSPEDLAQVIALLRVSHETMARELPTGIQEKRKAINHLLTGVLPFSEVYRTHLQARAEQLLSEKIAETSEAIERVEELVGRAGAKSAPRASRPGR